MLDHEILSHWALTTLVILPVAVFLFACVCCKKSVPKNDLLGLAGMVKITNPEEGSNQDDQPCDSDTTNIVVQNEVSNTNSNCPQSNKRTSATANRSLPDIPIASEGAQLECATVWEEGNGDTSSELYATVEENKDASRPLVSLRTTSREGKRLETLQDDSKESEHSSLSQVEDGFSPYACVNAEHPYDKLNKYEHPYAQVGNSLLSDVHYNPAQDYSERNGSTWSEESTSMPCPSTSISTDMPSSSSSSNPVPPPRTRKSSSQGSLHLESSSNTLSSPSPDIQAATAIAGRVSASHDLPYMTPPILVPGVMPDQQTNFSGDSQDSKGYTSISVREPLANIKAQTMDVHQRSRVKDHLDSHYATVSDDSDEMYDEIHEPVQQVYTSGSETYAQIQPAALASGPYHAPQPPSVDSLKQQVAQVHSRQASSSSATSSVANIGSPKPEKRQANSPLPPPPEGESMDGYASVMKKNLHLETGVSKNLDEMYAKVNKKKKPSGNEDVCETSVENLESPKFHKADTISHTSLNSHDSEFQYSHNSGEIDMDSMSSSDHNLSQDSRLEFDLHVPQDSFNICSISPRNIGAPLVTAEPGYESLGEPSSITLSYNDPGYETVNKLERAPSDCDPNYEQLKPQRQDDYNAPVSNNISLPIDSKIATEDVSNIGQDDNTHSTGYEHIGSKIETNRTEQGYSVVKKIVNNNNSSNNNNLEEGEDIEEPNYESMPSETQEPNYATLFGDTCGSESDPNYEIVNHGDDPNYESVNYSDIHNEPPYENLNGGSRDSDDTESSSGYEKLKSQDFKRSPGYERFHNDTQDSDDTYSSSGNSRDHGQEDSNSAYNSILAAGGGGSSRQDTSDTQASSGSNEPGYEEVGKKNSDSETYFE